MNTQEYYPAVKKSAITRCAATRTDLEAILLSEVRDGQIPYDTASMWNLKYDANELICETQTDSQARSTGLWLRGGECRREGSGA